MWRALQEWIKSAAVYALAFFSGVMKEKYDDAKHENAVQTKRDAIDAQRSADAAAVLERMRRGEL